MIVKTRRRDHSAILKCEPPDPRNVEQHVRRTETNKRQNKDKVHLEQAMKAQRGSRGIAFFSLGAKWEWVVIATPWPLHHRERLSTHHIGG